MYSTFPYKQEAPGTTICPSKNERNGSKWLPVEEVLCHKQTFAKLSQQMVSLASFLDEAFGKGKVQ